MEWVETTGRTIAEALDAALDELGVDEEDVEYEVLEEPKSGFLGRLGSSEGRIRARVKPISREKPGERQRRKGRGSSRPRGGSGGSGGRDNGGPTDEAARPSGSGRGRGSSGGSGRSEGSGRGGQKSEGQGSRNEPQQRSTVDTEREVPIEEQAAAAVAFTQGLVDTFDLGARAQSVIDDDVVVVEVTGENLGLLVGPKGATLHAIEELVRTVVQRQTDGHGVRIHVDVAGYRAKRRAALAEFTSDLATKVLETGRPQALEPMSASDRKVVHDTAAEIDGITTSSEGEDPRRHVVLRPV